jgi:hypothetical protein
MKLSLILGGLFIIIFICIVPLKRDIQEYDVQKNGELVTVSITYLPTCIGAKIRYFMEFTYSGKKFDKKVGCGHVENYKIGETIKFRHIEGTDIFLFPNETKEGEFIANGILAIMGIIFVFLGLKKK